MKKLTILIILILFTSCYTIKTAQKQVAKAHSFYPETTAFYCSLFYPVKDTVIESIRYVQGLPIIQKVPVEIDCDSVVNDTIISNRVIYKNIIETRIDTIFKDKEIKIRDTAFETVLNNNIAKQQIQIDRLTEINKWLIIILCGVAVYFLLKIKING